MKLLNSIFVLMGLLFIINSCRKDFDFDLASQKVRLNKDTIFLDTVFNQIRSETYAVKIFNNENKDVVIPKIFLRNLTSSYFKINVDGDAGFSFENVPLRKHDSLYIFVEVAPSLVAPNSALVEEDLVIQTVEEQVCKLVSVVEDVDLYCPQSGQSELNITNDMEWNNDKSKVIYGKVKITGNADLIINQGTKVYFHKESSLTIDTNSELLVNGTLNNPVLMRGDRHDTKYDTLPANWDKIHLKPNASANFNYAIIKGGNTAILAEKATINLQNTQLYNHTNYGIFSIQSTITGKNLVLNNFADAALAIVQGGTYDFRHCTFANMWRINSFSGSLFALYMSNQYIDEEGQLHTAPLDAYFGNSIFWSRASNSIGFKNNTEAAFTYLFDTNLIKLSSSNSYNPVTDANMQYYTLNVDPLFNSILMSNNNLTLQSSSPVRNIGKPSIASTVTHDIRNVNRTASPNLGAYQ